MSRVLSRICACATAFCVPFAVTAQSEGTEGEASVEAAAVTVPAKASARYFHTLVKLAFANDNVSVKLPRQSDFAPAKEGKFYPNGSVFRVKAAGSEPAVFEFGPEATVKVGGDAEFGVREVALGDNTRTITMISGLISVSLPRTLPTGVFAVSYPNFTAKDLAGESNHELTAMGDGNEAVVHVITGMLAIEGAHYSVARMSAADRVRIRTTAEALFTSLRGEAGDYKVSLDQGVVAYRDPISGETKDQVRKLDYSLTPQCSIKIFRKRSTVGGRMAVSVMTFDPAGEIRNRYTFAENTAKINFGEEIVRVQDISFKTKSSEKKPEAKAEEKKEESASEQESSQESSGASGNASEDSGFGSF